MSLVVPLRPERRKPESLRLRRVSPALTVDDIHRSLSFYQDVLGFVPKDRWEEGGGLRGVELVAGNVTVMLLQDETRNRGVRPKGVGQRLWFRTAQDVEALAKRVRARGGRVEEGSESRHGARFLTVTDPDGFTLTFAQES
jgi:catechol 2,3-dioxygenase-like lactoylglutathione lyase family enzyme